jgi:hypothetical protein
MNHFTSHRLPGLLLVCALTACTEKKTAAPTPPPASPSNETAVQAVAAPPPPAAPAAPAAPSAPAVAGLSRKATLDCEDRALVLEATCSDLNGPQLLACTRQSLSVADRTSGAIKAVRNFVPQPGVDGDPPLVDEKVGTLTCTRSAAGERYIVASMYNGGNCEACEWHDAYDWDGKLVASDRDRSQPSALLKELLSDAAQKSGRVTGQKELAGFYSLAAP